MNFGGIILRLLFVLGSIEPDDANSIIAKRIAGKLESWGHEICILGIRRAAISTTDKGLQKKGTHLIQQHNSYYSDGLKRIVDQQGAFRWWSLALKPWYLLELIWKKIDLGILQPRRLTRIYCEQTRKIVNEVHPDAVIAFSAPFYAAYGASKAVGDMTFIHYQLDPYSSNIFAKHKRFAVIKEARVCSVSKYVIGTRLLFLDYQRSPLREYLRKLIVAEFPCIRPMLSLRHDELGSTGNIKMLYNGALYPDIRSPRFMLQLFESLLIRMPNLQLRINGKAYGNTGAMLAEYKQRLGDRLQVCGEIDREDAEKDMARADFLVNIGNAIPNQLPNKRMGLPGRQWERWAFKSLQCLYHGTEEA